MKNFMPLQDNTLKPKPNLDPNKSFLKHSKSDLLTHKKHQKSTSPHTKKPELSKNDQRITLYTDPTGFLLEYFTLGYGLKCDCYILEANPKKNAKGLKLESIQPRQQNNKKKVKLEISLNKQQITTIKNGVEHIFSLPQQSKHNFLKVVLSENWELQQFSIPNKKTKVTPFQEKQLDEKDVDCVYPLKNITEADELRKIKLIKSESKIKISWGSVQKDSDQDSFNLNRSEIISFGSEKIFGELNRSTVVEREKQFQRSPFLKKSLHECDQTRDSEEDQVVEEKQTCTEKKLGPTQEKKMGLNEVKSLKNIHIDLSQWNYTPIIKESMKSPCRQTNFQYRILGQKGSGPKFFK